MRADPQLLETAIGHGFSNRGLLHRALTHSSHVHERPSGSEYPASTSDNEQLEFLGDAILGFLISEELVRRCPELPEGRLSQLKAHLVSASHLLGVAERLELGKYLQLGRGEELSGGRSKRTLLVDGLEALIAAIYLDSGIDAARRFVNLRVMGDTAEELSFSTDQSRGGVTDFKSALQELARSRDLPPPRYSVVKEYGPQHSKIFVMEVRVGRDHTGQAEGYSKKNAAQKAARAVFEQIQSSETETPVSEPRPSESGSAS